MSNAFQTHLERISHNSKIIAGAIATGLVAGTIFYFIDKTSLRGEQVAWIIEGCSALVAIFFLLGAMREKRVRWGVVAVVVGVIGLTVLVAIPERGSDFTQIMSGLFPALMLCAIGLAATQIGEQTSRQSLAARFFVYAQKLIEIIILSITFTFVMFMLAALVRALFEIVGFEIPQSFVEYIVFPLGATIPLLAWTFVYDFTIPVGEQAQGFLVKFFSTIGYGLTFLFTVFLAVYVFVLMPMGFSKLLATGTTSATFMALSFACAVLVYASILFKQSRHAVVHKITTSILLALLSVEAAIMSGVALYAITQRVDQYGVTLPRFFVSIACLVSTGLFISFVYSFIRSYSLQESLAELRVRIEKQSIAVIVILVLVAVFISVVNVEFLAVKSHVDRAIRTQNYFDVSYIRNGGKRSQDYMVAKYSQANPAQKIQIIRMLSETDSTKLNYFLSIEQNDVLKKIIEKSTADSYNECAKDAQAYLATIESIAYDLCYGRTPDQRIMH